MHSKEQQTITFKKNKTCTCLQQQRLLNKNKNKTYWFYRDQKHTPEH